MCEIFSELGVGEGGKAEIFTFTLYIQDMEWILNSVYVTFDLPL